MRQISRIILSFSLLTLVFQPGCVLSNSQDNGKNNSISKNSRKDSSTGEKKMLQVNRNVEDLVKTLKLKWRPTEAVWIEERLGNPDSSVPGPTDYRLVAVIKFSTADVTRIIEEAEKVEASRAGAIEIEEWFPEEFKKNQADEVEGVVYNAEGFANSPYSGGKLLHLKETNTFILRLHTF